MLKFLQFCGIVCVCLVSAPVFGAQSPRTLGSTTPARTQTADTRTTRSATQSISTRSAVQTARSATTSRSAATGTARSARTNQTSIKSTSANTARATIAPTSTSMGDGYNTCRDAYFTCMDQFCANKDETYRRCACSSRLDGLREMARKVGQTQGHLETFSDYNIDAISKTAKEVSASLTATTGESTALADKSESAQKLAGISAVLGGTKTKSLSTAGTLDIAGDIGAIWSTPDFIGGSDIANMEGEKLYSQVNSQCLSMVASACPREATLNMVVSAYGMYIEQDCNVALAAIEGRKITAAAAVRATGREMELARLENYDAHNSTEINECIAQVRKDLTADAACGTNFVHCLDMTGLYLDFNTGAPIYSPEFFKLEKQTTLDGDFMNANTNRLLLTALEEKKSAAARGLDTCRDVADDVWSEFKRQAIIEIYQAQQSRVKQVRDECLSVVNQCYDEKVGQLKNFANIDSQMLIGQSVGTAEALCKEKLDSCSNVFGGGSNGLASLLAFVHDVGSAKISENCQASLDKYIHEVCAVTGDLAHSYPYSCRVRNPGSYDCEMKNWSGASACTGQSGSVYELLVKYARENCVRTDFPADQPLPSDAMEYVNKVFDNVFIDMRTLLKTECERYSGEWLDNGNKSNIDLYTKLVSASDLWGVCIKPYCVFQGDSWLDSNGVKQCCPANSIADETCVTSTTPGCTAKNCRGITCPSGATINTSICDNSEKVLSTNPPTLGGCIGRTGSGSTPESQLPYCKCPTYLYSVPHNYNTANPYGAGDVVLEDQGKCLAKCDANSSWDTSCLVKSSSGTVGGCLSKYCRCNSGYKFMAGNGGSIGEIPIGGGITVGGPIGGGDLPYITMDRCVQIVNCTPGQYLPASAYSCIQCPANSWCAGGTYEIKSINQGITACGAGLVSAPGSSSVGACHTPICPANSSIDASCTAAETQAGCPPPDWLLSPGCVSAGCRCDLTYCSNGTACILQNI